MSFQRPNKPSADRSASIRDDAQGVDLAEFTAILARRWRLIATCAALGVGLGAAYVVATPQAFTATVSILLDVQPRAPLGSDLGLPPPSSPDAMLVETQVKLLAADTVLRRVAVQESLADDPEFATAKPGLRARLFALVGLRGPAAPSVDDRLSRAISTLARGVAVKRSERTYVVDVDVTSADPVKAARLANAMADAYIADQQGARSDSNRRDQAALNQRIAEMQTRLLEAENRAHDFKVRNGIADANGKNLVEQDLADLTTDLSRARARTADAKARADVARSLAASGRVPEPVGDVAKSAVLDKLRSQYAEISRQDATLRTTLGDRHPALREIANQLADTRRQIAAELKRVADAAATEARIAAAAEADTARRLDQARQATQANSLSLVQLRELERDVDASRTVYQKFLRSRESLNEEGGDGPTARVIAPAMIPIVPSAPKTTAILFIALAAGLFSGTGGALVVDFLGAAKRRNDDDETTAPIVPLGTDLHVVASVPRIGSRIGRWSALRDFMLRTRADARERDAGLLSEVSRHPDSPFSAAIRDLFHACQPDVQRLRAKTTTTVLVTSAQTGCGKSTIAANLARAAAGQGRRTLLIDANPFNPSLAPMIPETSPASLINLDGTFRPIHRVGDAGIPLFVVAIADEEEELCFRLAQRAAFEHVGGIAGNFDFVVIDGPALDDEEEARTVARAVDRIVLVAPFGDPAQPSIDVILERLDAPDLKFVGTVLSMVDTRKAA